MRGFVVCWSCGSCGELSVMPELHGSRARAEDRKLEVGALLPVAPRVLALEDVAHLLSEAEREHMGLTATALVPGA